MTPLKKVIIFVGFMLQVYKGDHFGMNTPGCDNQQFALNIVHWLTRTI